MHHAGANGLLQADPASDYRYILMPGWHLQLRPNQWDESIFWTRALRCLEAVRGPLLQVEIRTSYLLILDAYLPDDEETGKTMDEDLTAFGKSASTFDLSLKVLVSEIGGSTRVTVDQ